MFFSVVSRRTLGGLLGTYVTVVVAYVAVPIFLAAFGGSDEFVLVASNPFVAYAAGLENELKGVGYLIAFSLGHGIAGALLWGLAIGFVDRVRGRD